MDAQLSNTTPSSQPSQPVPTFPPTTLGRDLSTHPMNDLPVVPRPAPSSAPVVPLNAISAAAPAPNPEPTRPIHSNVPIMALQSHPMQPTATPPTTPPIGFGGGAPGTPAPKPTVSSVAPTSAPGPKAAKPPRSPLVTVFLALLVGGLLALSGWFVWGFIGPQSTTNVASSPTPRPTNQPLTSATPTPGTDSAGGGMVACTMDAMVCPDGSSVGRSGPNCEFDACPGSTKGGQATAAPTTNPTGTGTSNWDTYKNPAYSVSFRFPTTWEVRTVPSPRADIVFRHAFGPRQNFAAQGYLEVSTLPLLELIEQVKLAEGGTAGTTTTQTVSGQNATALPITKGSVTNQHWFIRKDDKTYHLTATGSAPEVAEIAKTIQW